MLTAVHVQFVPETTESELVLPIDNTGTLVGVTDEVHCACAARTSSITTIATSSQQYRAFISTAWNQRMIRRFAGGGGGVAVPAAWLNVTA
jgi:hypothetical protein